MNLKMLKLEKEIKHYRNKNQRLTVRLIVLLELSKVQLRRPLRDGDYRLVASRFEKTARTLYNWKQLYDKGGALKLAPRKAPGKKPEAIKGWTAKIIKEMRTQFNWGAEVICAHLREYHKIKISEGKVLRYLKRTGLLKIKRITSKFKYHTKIVKVFDPGAHTQMDVKYLPHLLGEKKKCYVYNFVDHASRWQIKKAYDSYGCLETEDFMKYVLNNVPFKIRRLQTDNGAEFTNIFAKKVEDPTPHILNIICDKNDIQKRLIPPGEKELNGLVERSHRQDDNQLYNTIKPHSLNDFNLMLADYWVWNNSYRLRRATGWITADRYIKIWSSIKKNNDHNKVTELITEKMSLAA